MTDPINRRTNRETEFNPMDWAEDYAEENSDYRADRPERREVDEYCEEGDRPERRLSGNNVTRSDVRGLLNEMRAEAEAQGNDALIDQIDDFKLRLRGEGPVRPSDIRELALIQSDLVGEDTHVSGRRSGQADAANGAEDTSGNNGHGDSEVNALRSRVRSSRLPESVKTALNRRLDQAQAAADLGNDDRVLEIMDDVEARLNEGQTNPKAAALAQALGKSVEEVQDAFGNVDIESLDLSQPPTEEVMHALAQLGVPSEESIGNVSSKIDDFHTELGRVKSEGDRGMQGWRGDSESVPSNSNFDKALQMWQGTDSISNSINRGVTDMRSNVLRALTALGYQATAGSKASEINLGGGRSFYFFDYENRSITSSSTPREMEHNPSDYPTLTYNTATGDHGPRGHDWFIDKYNRVRSAASDSPLHGYPTESTFDVG